jgi:hypothetical protein
MIKCDSLVVLFLKAIIQFKFDRDVCTGPELHLPVPDEIDLRSRKHRKSTAHLTQGESEEEEQLRKHI